jgi:peptide chain release factor 1
MICTSQTRSRDNSFKLALSALTEKVNQLSYDSQHQAQSTIKRKQVGSGMRGDKIRTIRFQDDRATDHRNDKRCKASAYMKGGMDQLWD